MQDDASDKHGRNGHGEGLKHLAVPSTGPVRAIEPRRSLLPAIMPAGPMVIAAGGFAAGAAAIATLSAVRSRRRARPHRRRKEIQRSVVATRSFLVDVHLLGR